MIWSPTDFSTFVRMISLEDHFSTFFRTSGSGSSRIRTSSRITFSGSVT